MADIDLTIYLWNDEEYDMQFGEGDTDSEEEVITTEELDSDVQHLREQALKSRKRREKMEEENEHGEEGQRNDKGAWRKESGEGGLATVDSGCSGESAKSGWRRRRRRNKPAKPQEQDLRIGLVQSFWQGQHQLCRRQAVIAKYMASGRYLRAARKQPKYTNYYNKKGY